MNELTVDYINEYGERMSIKKQHDVIVFNHTDIHREDEWEDISFHVKYILNDGEKLIINLTIELFEKLKNI